MRILVVVSILFAFASVAWASDPVGFETNGVPSTPAVSNAWTQQGNDYVCSTYKIKVPVQKVAIKRPLQDCEYKGIAQYMKRWKLHHQVRVNRKCIWDAWCLGLQLDILHQPMDMGKNPDDLYLMYQILTQLFNRVDWYINIDQTKFPKYDPEGLYEGNFTDISIPFVPVLRRAASSVSGGATTIGTRGGVSEHVLGSIARTVTDKERCRRGHRHDNNCGHTTNDSNDHTPSDDGHGGGSHNPFPGPFDR